MELTERTLGNGAIVRTVDPNLVLEVEHKTLLRCGLRTYRVP